MQVIFGGVGPLLIVPLANTYGRRPVYLGGNLLAAVTNVAAGYCSTWSGILVTRVFNGIGAGSTVAIGAATICDLYFLHERGLYMGVYTFFLTNGPHIAPLIGGFIAQNLGWRWCFRIPAFIQLAVFVVNLLCLPETLYSRRPDSPGNASPESSRLDLLLFRSKHLPQRKVRPRDFARPFTMLRYICVTIPAIYYMTSFGYGTVIFGRHIPLSLARWFASLLVCQFANSGTLPSGHRLGRLP